MSQSMKIFQNHLSFDLFTKIFSFSFKEEKIKSTV